MRFRPTAFDHLEDRLALSHAVAAMAEGVPAIVPVMVSRLAEKFRGPIINPAILAAYRINSFAQFETRGSQVGIPGFSAAQTGTPIR